jgi:hypothetical protein
MALAAAIGLEQGDEVQWEFGSARTAPGHFEKCPHMRQIQSPEVTGIPHYNGPIFPGTAISRAHAKSAAAISTRFALAIHRRGQALNHAYGTASRTKTKEIDHGEKP